MKTEEIWTMPYVLERALNQGDRALARAAAMAICVRLGVTPEDLAKAWRAHEQAQEELGEEYPGDPLTAMMSIMDDLKVWLEGELGRPVNPEDVEEALREAQNEA